MSRRRRNKRKNNSHKQKQYKKNKRKVPAFHGGSLVITSNNISEFESLIGGKFGERPWQETR